MKLYVWIFMILFNTHLLCAQETKVWVSSVEGDREEFQGSNVFDGDRETRWSSNFEDKQNLKIILPQAQNLEDIRIIWEKSHAKRYKIKVSEDKKKWTMIHNEKNKETLDQDFVKLKSPMLVKYINFEFLQRNTEYGYSIFEIKLNGQILKKFLAQDKKGSEQLDVLNSEQKTNKFDAPKLDKKKDTIKPVKTDKFIYI